MVSPYSNLHGNAGVLPGLVSQGKSKSFGFKFSTIFYFIFLNYPHVWSTDENTVEVLYIHPHKSLNFGGWLVETIIYLIIHFRVLSGLCSSHRTEPHNEKWPLIFNLKKKNPMLHHNYKWKISKGYHGYRIRVATSSFNFYWNYRQSRNDCFDFDLSFNSSKRLGRRRPWVGKTHLLFYAYLASITNLWQKRLLLSCSWDYGFKSYLFELEKYMDWI